MDIDINHVEWACMELNEQAASLLITGSELSTMRKNQPHYYHVPRVTLATIQIQNMYVHHAYFSHLQTSQLSYPQKFVLTFI